MVSLTTKQVVRGGTFGTDMLSSVIAVNLLSTDEILRAGRSS